MQNTFNILYIDSDKNFAKKIEMILKSHHLNTFLVFDYKKVWDKCKKLNPHILISELDFEESNILEQLSFIKKQKPQLPIIVYSSCNETEIMIQAIDVGVEDYINKENHRIDLFVSKLKNIIRRTYNESSSIRLSQYTTYNDTTKVLKINKEEIKLKPNDACLLELLCNRINEFADKDYLCQGMWNMTGREKELRRYILRLRKILTADRSLQIENNWGGFYRLKVST